jgi:membrane associated rhomboid family serine protease
VSDGDLGAPGQPGMTPEQIAYMRGQQDAIRRLTTPRMTVFRVICGIVWGVLAVGFAFGAVYNLVHPNIVQALFGVVFAGLAGWYDYRIWTLKARRLFLII